jgi:integrase
MEIEVVRDMLPPCCVRHSFARHRTHFNVERKNPAMRALKQARKLIEKASGLNKIKVFNLSSASLDALFRKAKGRAEIEGITFHDSRHTAATWLAPRMDVLDLCKMFGWSNPKQAMTYYNPTASQIAARIKA